MTRSMFTDYIIHVSLWYSSQAEWQQRLRDVINEAAGQQRDAALAMQQLQQRAQSLESQIAAFIQDEIRYKQIIVR